MRVSTIGAVISSRASGKTRSSVRFRSSVGRGHVDCVSMTDNYHHPTPVEIPEWHHQAFYERVLGSRFEKTEELEDAKQFLDWARHRSFVCVVAPRAQAHPQG